MARTGRPRKPVEQHKRNGTYKPGRHGSSLAVVAPIDSLPHEATPSDAFADVMANGVGWLAQTDAPTLALLRSSLEEREPLRDAAIAGSVEARKMLRDLDKQIMTLLSQLGFDPAARARLGLAEVKAQSRLEDLRARRSAR